MAILSWIIVGALIGWMFGLFTGQVEQQQTVTNVAAGVIGGVLFGMITGLGGDHGVSGFTWYTYISATIGAVVLLLIKYFVMR